MQYCTGQHEGVLTQFHVQKKSRLPDCMQHRIGTYVRSVAAKRAWKSGLTALAATTATSAPATCAQTQTSSFLVPRTYNKEFEKTGERMTLNLFWDPSSKIRLLS